VGDGLVSTGTVLHCDAEATVTWPTTAPPALTSPSTRSKEGAKSRSQKQPNAVTTLCHTPAEYTRSYVAIKIRG